VKFPCLDTHVSEWLGGRLSHKSKPTLYFETCNFHKVASDRTMNPLIMEPCISI